MPLLFSFHDNMDREFNLQTLSWAELTADWKGDICEG